MTHYTTEARIRKTAKRLDHYCDQADEGSLQARCGKVFLRYHPGRDTVRVRDLAYWWLGYMGNAIGQPRLRARDIIDAWQMDLDDPDWRIR